MNVIDLHCDTIWRLMDSKGAEHLEENSYCVDIKKLQQAGALAQFFACFIWVKQFQMDFEEGYRYALDSIELAKKELERNQKQIQLTCSVKELELHERRNIISAFLTIEEGGILYGDIGRVKELYDRGIRLITLLWNEENCIGYPNSRDGKIHQKGLKPFGRDVVAAMNEKKMLIDVSHLSEGGFWDVLQLSSAPVVASHSNARALCDHPRNLDDAMIRALAEKGGIAGLNFYSYFLNGTDQMQIIDLVRHVKHMMRIGGEDFVALGTDFDGFDDTFMEISHIGQIERFYDALKQEGITERQIDKIRSQNALRVMKCVLD